MGFGWYTKKRTLGLLAGASTLSLVTLASSEARADCPPGSWFCQETQPAPGQPPPASLQPLPPPAAAPPPAAPPPVVVYQPPPPPPTVVVREAPPPYVYTPRPPDYPRKNEWGLNLHLGGAFFGKGRTSDAGAGVIGAGLRFRPIAPLAIQADLDLAGGRDYNGFRRSEAAFLLNGLLFVNPKDKAQLYFLAGFGWAGATAVDDSQGYDGPKYRYSYFGMQAGVGLEFRPTRHLALNADLRGFVRGRIDRDRQYDPEFTDAQGRSTNTSGGGLFMGGITFYF